MHYPYEWISYQWKTSIQCQKPVSAKSNRSDHSRERGCFVFPMNDAPSHSVQHTCPKSIFLTCFLYRSLQYPIQVPYTAFCLETSLTGLQELPLSPVSSWIRPSNFHIIRISLFTRKDFRDLVMEQLKNSRIFPLSKKGGTHFKVIFP